MCCCRCRLAARVLGRAGVGGSWGGALQGQLGQAFAEALAKLRCCSTGTGRHQLPVLLLLLVLLPLQGVLAVRWCHATVALPVKAGERLCVGAGPVGGCPAATVGVGATEVGGYYAVQGCHRLGQGLRRSCGGGGSWAA